MSAASTKPYLLRALHEWCTDQGLTPYLAVQVDAQTRVPRQYVQDGQIVLNIGLDAVQNLQMDNEIITFQARFGGVAQAVAVPVANVSAIYARENGQGMAFEVGAELAAGSPDAELTGGEAMQEDMQERAAEREPGAEKVLRKEPGKARPHLTRVK